MAESPPPLFLLAAPFSGASWLAGVLGRHPGLYALPQIFPFMADTVGDLLDLFALSQVGQGDGLRRAVAEIVNGSQGEAAIAAADRWLERHRDWSGARLIGELAECVAPRRLVIPDSEMPLRPHELRRFRAALPQARCLHLSRHPWTQGYLMAAWLHEQLFIPVDFRDQAQEPQRPEPQLPWLRANHNLRAAAAEWPAGQWRHQAGEQFDSDFAAGLRELLGWLELPLDAPALAAMAEPAGWCFAAIPEGPARGGLEPEVHAEFSPELRAEAGRRCLGEPLPWRPDRLGFAPEVLAMARQLGYR